MLGEIFKLKARIARLEQMASETAQLIEQGYGDVSPQGVPWPRPLTDCLNWQRHALTMDRAKLAQLEASA